MTAPLPNEPIAPEPSPPSEPEEDAPKKELSRRKLLKLLAAGGAATVISNLPVEWAKPVVEVGVLPAHAESSSSPNPATQLTAQAISSTQIDLAWQDNSSEESRFVLERSTDGVTNWVVVKNDISFDSTSYSDTGLTGGQTYYYRVKAKGAEGKGTYSNIAVATTP